MKRISKNEVAPELRKYIVNLPNWFIINSLGRKILKILRRIILQPKVKFDVNIKEITIENNLELRLYIPKVLKSDAGLLWIHGGGKVIGDPKDTDIIMSQTSEKLGLMIIAPRYRHAPENPFPAHLDDCFSAWQWMLDSRNELNFNKNRIAIGGLSAGGGLAASLAHKILDMGGIQPVAQWLFCPMLDDRTATKTELDEIKHFIWNNELNRYGWQSYLGPNFGKEKVLEFSVPSRRENLAGLPPVWIGIGTIDLFYEEDKEYADRLKAAGVDVTFVAVPKAYHGFEILANNAVMAQTFLSDARLWLQNKLNIND